MGAYLRRLHACAPLHAHEQGSKTISFWLAIEIMTVGRELDWKERILRIFNGRGGWGWGVGVTGEANTVNENI